MVICQGTNTYNKMNVAINKVNHVLQSSFPDLHVYVSTRKGSNKITATSYTCMQTKWDRDDEISRIQPFSYSMRILYMYTTVVGKLIKQFL